MLDLAYGCDIKDFCCRRDCKEVVKMDIPRCLVAAIAAVWNNDIKALNVKNAFKLNKNGKISNMTVHSLNAGYNYDAIKKTFKYLRK